MKFICHIYGLFVKFEFLNVHYNKIMEASVMEDLCQRIFDIQLSLEMAISSPIDSKQIQELSAQMSQIEHELELYENQVDAMLPLIDKSKEIIKEIQTAKQIFSSAISQ